MAILTPHLSILSAAQREIWGLLKPTPKHFVLYGGTALDLRLGHRQSLDFDFLSNQPFQPHELQGSIPYLHGQQVTQQEKDTLTCEVRTSAGIVRLSFFGGLGLRQIDPPDTLDSNGIAVASLRDLFGMKCAAVTQRNAVRDYQDIHALITSAGIDLAQGIACARAIYGVQYAPMMTLRALCYFDDLPEALPQAMKADLLKAVQSCSVDKLPQIDATQPIGAPGPRPPRRTR